MFNDSRHHSVSDAVTAGGGTLTLLVTAGVTALTLSVAFGLLALGIRSFWIAFPVGFGVVLPGMVALIRARHTGEHRNTATSRTDASPTGLEALRRRYAAGELSDEEFEHRVECLLSSETDGSTRSAGTDAGRR
jgi:uncharacterized membrane protein